MDEMKNNRKAMLNTAALVDLKAELIRKQDILKKDRLQRGYDIEIKSLKLKNDTGKLQVPVRGPSKKSLDNEKLIELREEEEKQLKRSREMLEQKAKIYEQMSTGETQLTEEESELYMVDFSKKTVFDGLIHQKPNATSNKDDDDENDDKNIPIPNADWVDFIDKYGKKRTCLREDLPYYQDSNKASTFNLNTPNSVSRDNVSKVDTEPPKDPEPVGPIHYQNVRNKEVRAHGVGYFAFSENENERQKQMDMLKNMRQQTMKQRDLKERAKEKRTALLKARLDKVRQRKNIEKPEEENEEQNSDEEQALEDIPLPDEIPKGDKEEEEIGPRPFRLRPWDKGKDFSQVQIPKFEPPKFNVSSRNYAEKRREERLNEFAPPDIYSKTKKPKTDANYGNFKSGGQWLPKSSHESSTLDSSANDNFSDCDNVEQSANSSNVEESDNIEDMVARQLRMFRNNRFQD